MRRKIIYIILALLVFNVSTGFNITRIPRWFKGIWNYNDGKYIEATNEFDKAKSGESDAVMTYNKGAAQYRDGDYKSAEESFTKATESDPQFEAAYYNQGNARFKKGDLKGAVESYEKALEIDLNDEDARHNLEYVKKLLEQKNNAGDTSDPQENQERQNPQASDRESRSTKESGSEDLTGKENEDKQNKEKQGESEGGQGMDDREEKNQQGGVPKEKEEKEEPPKEEPGQSKSGLSEQAIKEILEALEQEEKALAGQLDRNEQTKGRSPTDPFGIFDELFSIADDLDPFATPKYRKRDKNEIDW